MPFRLLADLVLVVHFLFILFVVGGAFLVLRWRGWVWLHAPAALWGAWIEFSAGVCPLTPLEKRLRAAAGQETYDTGFVEHYLLPLVYPAGMTRGVQLALGVAVVVLNLAVYGWLWRAVRRKETI